MRVRPVRLNMAMACLFMVGSFCFVVGSIPAYINAVGGVVDGITYFVGSIFFTSASFLQLVQAQSPAMTEVDTADQSLPASVCLWRWLPHDRNWLAAASQFPGTLFFNVSTLFALARNATVQHEDRYVWRPDIIGSTLFLVASAFGILALGKFLSLRPRSIPWWIAWINMAGSVLFMASAIAAYVVPSSGDELNTRIAVVGTLSGAACFLVGAALMIPGWRAAVGVRATSVPTSRPAS